VLQYVFPAIATAAAFVTNSTIDVAATSSVPAIIRSSTTAKIITLVNHFFARVGINIAVSILAT